MMAALARAVMAVAVHSLGDHRREWALAMQVEFEAAIEDGRPLDFAIGCLVGAWREMPAHEEGRFVLASYVLVIGMVIPMASLLILGALLGLPYLYPWHVEFPGLVAGSGGQELAVTDANRGAIPSLAIIVLLLGAAHLRIAWVILERDWERVAVMGRLNAAATATLVIFTGVLFFDDAQALMQAAVLAVELTAIAVLTRWHAQISPDASATIPAS